MDNKTEVGQPDLWLYRARIPAKLKPYAKKLAKSQDRSLNSLIVSVLRKEIVQFRKEQGETQPDLFDDLTSK